MGRTYMVSIQPKMIVSYAPDMVGGARLTFWNLGDTGLRSPMIHEHRDVDCLHKQLSYHGEEAEGPLARSVYHMRTAYRLTTWTN